MHQSKILILIQTNNLLRIIDQCALLFADRLDDENLIEEPVINITPVETTRAFWQYQRRGSAPIDLPPMSRGGERRELLTRHTSLNGKSGRRKKQLRRRSSGGPETVCFPESHSEIISRLLLRRPENPDTLLARRRGSLPIEVLTVGHSGKSKVDIKIFILFQG